MLDQVVLRPDRDPIPGDFRNPDGDSLLAGLALWVVAPPEGKAPSGRNPGILARGQGRLVSLQPLPAGRPQVGLAGSAEGRYPRAPSPLGRDGQPEKVPSVRYEKTRLLSCRPQWPVPGEDLPGLRQDARQQRPPVLGGDLLLALALVLHPDWSSTTMAVSTPGSRHRSGSS